MNDKRKTQGHHLNDATARLRAVCASIMAATFLVACGGGAADDSSAAQPESTAQQASAQATALAPDTVRIRLGLVRGNAYDGGVEFLGIPFAKPPVGSLRWRPPADPQPWTSTLATQAFRPACPQKRFDQGKDTYTLEGEEDCLYLNVWKPAATGLTALPVLVFIHGGGQQQGSAAQIISGTQVYSGRNMATRGPAVVVTLQYRLGPLGYLVHPGLETENTSNASGNYGVMDQIQALKWVKDNAIAFGGDPTRVMVFGESAGGVNVGNLMVTPLAKGLFQRAGIQSAVPLIGAYTAARADGIDFVNGFTQAATNAEKIAAMRALDWQSMVATETNPVEGGIVQMSWRPVVDQLVFKTDAPTAFASGQYNHVPLLIGTNADESSVSAPPTVTPGVVAAFILAKVPAPYQAQALQLYPPGNTNEQARESYVQMLTDGQFTSPVRRTARAIAPTQAEPVWRYFFSYRHAAALGTLGSYHGMELHYVFNTWENATIGSFTSDDAAVQSQMLRNWVDFARTGNPNSPGSLVVWPQFEASADCHLEITAPSASQHCGLRTEKSDFWDAIASR